MTRQSTHQSMTAPTNTITLGSLSPPVSHLPLLVIGYRIDRRSFGEENLAAFIVIERHDVERKVGRSHSYHQPSA